MAAVNTMPSPHILAIPSPSFSTNRHQIHQIRGTTPHRIFKRPSPLTSKTRPSTSSSPSNNNNNNANTFSTSSSSSKYLQIPGSKPRSVSTDRRFRLKIAHRQKRCMGSPDSPRIGVEDLQRYADACGIPLPAVTEEAVHDTFSIQIAVPKEEQEKGVATVVDES